MYQHHFCIVIEEILRKEMATDELKYYNIADFIAEDPFAYIGLILGFKYRDKELETAYENLKIYIEKYQREYFDSVGKELKNFDKMIKDLEKLLNN